MKIVSLVGARPQFVKLAPLCRALRGNRGVHHVIVHSGQHYDYRMSKVFFDRLQIPEPEYNLAVGSGSHAAQTARCLERFDRVLEKEKPDWVLIYGDTNTTLAGALAARQRQLRLAHVEAGLRSFNRLMPEESNRIVADHCSDLLFCPTRTAMRHLRTEGIGSSRTGFQRAVLVGDIMVDILKLSVQRAGSPASLLKRLGVDPGRFALVTIHRAENTNHPERLRSILAALGTLAKDRPVLFPAHPRTLVACRRYRLSGLLKPLQVVAPMDYFEMLQLESTAGFILTDSGGVQKEAYLLKTPCVTVREETEWPETLRSGWNRLAGWHTQDILSAARRPVSGNSHPACFGDGHTGERIVSLLIRG